MADGNSAKRKKYFCSFKEEWLNEYEWLKKRNEYEGECRLCRQTFSVKYEGVRAITNHCDSDKHNKSVKNEKESKKSACISDFFTTRIC